MRALNRSGFTLIELLIALVIGLLGVGLWITARPVLELYALSQQYAASSDAAMRQQLLAAGEALLTSYEGTAYANSQIMIAAAGLMNALLMRHSPCFRPVTAIIGMVLPIFSLQEYIQ